MDYPDESALGRIDLYCYIGPRERPILLAFHIHVNSCSQHKPRETELGELFCIRALWHGRARL